jgi:hypothetical protein
MTYQGTGLVAFKQAFIARLTLRPALAGVKVTYAFPDKEVAAENIWLGDANAETWIPVHRAGKKKVDEDFHVDCIIQVLKRQGESQEVADIRANQLFAEVQSDLAEQPQTDPDIFWAELDGWEHFCGILPSGGGHGSRFELKIRVRNRLF